MIFFWKEEYFKNYKNYFRFLLQKMISILCHLNLLWQFRNAFFLFIILKSFFLLFIFYFFRLGFIGGYRFLFIIYFFR